MSGETTDYSLMKIIHVLFGFLILLLLLMGISFFLPNAFDATHAPHSLDPKPASAALLHSIEKVANSNQAIGIGWLMTLLISGIMGSVILLGVRHKGQAGPYRPWIIGAFIVVALVFSALTYSYSSYTQGLSDTFFGGYPAPTAWMIYGIWFLPIGIIAIFIATFDQWFLRPEDLAAFRQMVQASQEEKGGPG